MAQDSASLTSIQSDPDLGGGGAGSHSSEHPVMSQAGMANSSHRPLEFEKWTTESCK